MNKTISTPIAIIIVLIVFTISIGLILLGYLYIPKPKYEPVSEEIEEMDISNWETYRNEEYGFEIKYPKNWTINDNSYTYNGIKSSGITILSESRYDLQGYESVGAKYLINLSFVKEEVFVNYQGFIKVYQVGDQAVEDIFLEESFLKNTKEYIVAQRIIQLAGFLKIVIEESSGKLEEEEDKSCNDSEGESRNPYIAGTINQTQSDYCKYDDNSVLIEYYCLNDEIKYEEIICENGCKSGACLPSETVNTDHVCLDHSLGCFFPTFRNLDNDILNKLNQLITFEDVAHCDSCEDLKNNKCGNWAISYQVNYDKGNILNLFTTISGIGAYPFENETNYIINLINGEFVKVSDIFYSDEIVNLLDYLNVRLQNNIDEQIEYVKAINPSGEDRLCSEDDIVKWGLGGKNAKFTEKNVLNLKVISDGIEFIYEFNFAHAIKACEPNGEIFLTYDELKQFIDKDGLLGQEIK